MMSEYLIDLGVAMRSRCLRWAYHSTLAMLAGGFIPVKTVLDGV